MALPQRTHQRQDPATGLSHGVRVKTVFLGIVLVVASFYTVILGYHFSTPRRTEITSVDWMDGCREFCLRYGLIPTGHIANDARAYLEASRSDAREQQATATSGETFLATVSQEHPLLGETAPNFSLSDDRGDLHELQQYIDRGPVVLVFYYGYHCSHCVAQLFALQEELARFQSLGATVLALSGDESEQTAERFAEYGRFDYPVLSDQNNLIAEEYDVYRPETIDHPEDLKHATFLIDRDGRIVWAYRGTKPFIDNRSLLSRLADDLHSVAVTSEPGFVTPVGRNDSIESTPQ